MAFTNSVDKLIKNSIGEYEMVKSKESKYLLNNNHMYIEHF